MGLAPATRAGGAAAGECSCPPLPLLQIREPRLVPQARFMLVSIALMPHYLVLQHGTAGYMGQAVPGLGSEEGRVRGVAASSWNSGLMIVPALPLSPVRRTKTQGPTPQVQSCQQS